jgi:hypothetical protein
MWELVACIKKAYRRISSENTALEKIFEPKSVEIAGDWRKFA